MFNRALTLELLFLVAMILGFVTFVTTPPELKNPILGWLKAPVIVSRKDPPELQLEKPLYNLGVVIEGSELPHVIPLHNVGGEPLIISKVYNSCGCTLLTLKDKVIAPGKTGELEVLIDTTMKQGTVVKPIEIYSNDPTHPKTTVHLSANIIPRVISSSGSGGTSGGAGLGTPVDPHANLTNSDRQLKMFGGQCASCHVSQGIGKSGGPLFEADCAMCHGSGGKGAEAPGLLGFDYSNPDVVKQVRTVIREGSPRHLSMPGFAKSSGGPLSDAQIESLITFLKAEAQNTTASAP